MLLIQLPESTNTFDFQNFVSVNLIVRMAINYITVFTLIKYIYFKNYNRTDLFVTFFVFNTVIFMITFLLNKVEMSMGAAFGLFAVFSMLRYRTEGISAKDMTYLFMVIAVGLISAISPGNGFELGFFCLLLVVVTHLLEGAWLIKRELSKPVIYENINLIKPEYREELIHDLRNRTGLDIHRVEIEDIDFLKDATKMKVFYYPTTTDISFSENSLAHIKSDAI